MVARHGGDVQRPAVRHGFLCGEHTLLVEDSGREGGRVVFTLVTGAIGSL